MRTTLAAWIVAIAACHGPAPRGTPALVAAPQPDAMTSVAPDAGLPEGGDADGDMVSNQCDRCPVDPEMYNGWEDDDGCPDRLEPYRQTGIFFADGDDTLDAQSAALLVHFAETLAYRDDWEIVAVVARASSDEQTPKALARRRAAAVTAALVAAGVDTARLAESPRGDEPFEDDGSDPAWHARRTDLVIAREGGVDRDVDQESPLTLYLPLARVTPPGQPGCPLGPLPQPVAESDGAPHAAARWSRIEAACCDRPRCSS